MELADLFQIWGCGGENKHPSKINDSAPSAKRELHENVFKLQTWL